ncbi:DnaD domain-containing protein [Eupransor demetentiae]|uniref:DNA replication protein DnaD (DnaD) n=1 Tax=Eupransor demetentiae TaxID=3109584 RepID=A0ABM9N4H3_9LACO|nr:DNA replication protein DnaD (DnaD) [Lactobacillaceae bacterium LMG 33000]
MEANFKRYLAAGQTAVSNELLMNYRKIGMDNDDLMLYLQIERIQARGDYANPAVLARILQVTESAVVDRLKSLLKRKLLTVEGRQKQTESYDFSPMFEKLLGGQRAEVAPETLSDGVKSKRQVMQTVEAEFGRSLSAMEMQTIGHWFDQDHFDPNMMLLALKEAVLNNVRNLRYIETILANWQREQLNSPQAVEMAKRKRRGVTYVLADQKSGQKGKVDFKLPHQKIEDM